MTKSISDIKADKILSKEYKSKTLPRDLSKEKLLVPRSNYRLENNFNKIFTPLDEEKLKQELRPYDFANNSSGNKGTLPHYINKIKNYFPGNLQGIKKYFSKKHFSDFL